MAAFPKALAVLAVALAVALPAALATPLCVYPQNYGITIDHSGSVTNAEYLIQKQFVRDFVIASNVPGSKYYITSFATSVASPAIANSYANPALDVVAAVNSYARPGTGDTGIGNAIKDLTDKLVAAGVTKGTLVVITDGTSNTGVNPVTEANVARSKGLRVVAVGVGPDVSDSQLTAVAAPSDPTNPGLYVKIGNTGYSGLPAKLDEVIKAACPSTPTCIETCKGRTGPASCPASSSWTPCQSCTTNSLVLSYSGAAATCTNCLAAGPSGLDRCFWCVTNALTLAKGKTAYCSCCDKVYNCYNTLENSLVNQKGWERYVLRCKEKFATTAEQDSCFWCLTNALTTDPKTCTKDTLDFCA